MGVALVIFADDVPVGTRRMGWTEAVALHRPCGFTALSVARGAAGTQMRFDAYRCSLVSPLVVLGRCRSESCVSCVRSGWL